MIIHCKEQFKEAVIHAKKINDKSLAECLIYMHDREKKHDVVYNIYSDRAPLSFYFVCMFQGNMYYNGGIIFHGSHDGYGNGGAPTFSVSIDKAEGWRVHT